MYIIVVVQSMEDEVVLEELLAWLTSTLHAEVGGRDNMSAEDVSTYVSCMFVPTTLVAIMHFPETIFCSSVSEEHLATGLQNFNRMFISEMQEIHTYVLRDVLDVQRAFRDNSEHAPHSLQLDVSESRGVQVLDGQESQSCLLHEKSTFEIIGMLLGGIAIIISSRSSAECQRSLRLLCKTFMQASTE